MTEFSRSIDWREDPKHAVFVFSRYKFVGKMLEGRKNVLEVGAGDGIASSIVAQFVGNLTLTDIKEEGGVSAHNIIESPLHFDFDAAYSIDVIEHIDPLDTWTFLKHMRDSLLDKGVCIIGSPSLESQSFASPRSKKHHINCMSASMLREQMLKHFPTVFMFGMNDEIVHTGFEGMRHYNLAVGVK